MDLYRDSARFVLPSDAILVLMQTSPPELLTDQAVLVAHESADLFADSSDVSFLWIATQPVFWSATIMLSIVSLLYAWEETVAESRQKLPETLTPVVDSMLAEMGGLGFIGLFLSTVVTGGPLGHVVGELSENFLGDEEILLESFEFLHSAFFEVGIAFFFISGLTVAKVLKRIGSMEEISVVAFDCNKDGIISLDELADALQVEALPVDLDQDGELSEQEIMLALRNAKIPSLWEEVTMTSSQIKAEALVIRERFIQSCEVSPTFRIETYFGKIFGDSLEEIVELSPLTWLPLIPFLSLGRSVDMSRDIVSAASPNSSLSCGCFLGSPEFFVPNSLLVIASVVWALFNFWKVTQVKAMLVPLLVRDSSCNNRTILLPPRYRDKELLSNFNSSPSIFGWVENFFAKPSKNDHHRLFGNVGSAGPAVYRNSIKYQTWLAVSQIILFGSQIVTRDANAILNGLETGKPDLVVPEFFIFSFYVLLCMFCLWLAPQTFLNHSLTTSIEILSDQKAIQESMDPTPVGLET